MKENEKEPSVASSIQNYGNLGIEFFSAVLVGTVGGFFIDKYINTHPAFLILGLVVGAVAGFRNLYSFIKREEERDSKASKNAGK